jgi:hypothetical protein
MIIPMIGFIAVYAALATVFGEATLESPITGEPTTFGYIVVLIPVVLFASVVLLSLISIIAEKASHGKIQLMNLLLPKIKRTFSSFFVIGLTVGFGLILLSALSLVFPAEEQVGANIGAPFMILAGVVTLLATVGFRYLNNALRDKATSPEKRKTGPKTLL